VVYEGSGNDKTHNTACRTSLFGKSAGDPSVTVLDEVGSCGRHREGLSNAASEINQAMVPYDGWGPNSNTVARELLEGAGLPQEHPDVIVWGWDDDID
jgi:hypothetical protein